MNITTEQVREIRQEFGKLKPVKVTLDGNRRLTVKEAIRALAPTLERMKKRGFDIQELIEKLHEKGIDVKPPTLAKYLNEFKRGKEKKTDTPPAQGKKEQLQTESRIPSQKTTYPERLGGFVVPPDTPLGEL